MSSRRWPPRPGLRILKQIALLQIFFYLTALILVVFISLAAGKHVTLDLILGWQRIRGDVTEGWILSLVWMLSSLVSVVFILLLIARSDLVANFSITIHLIHLVVTSVYSHAIPTNFFWWALQVASTMLMVLLGMWSCQWRELRPIDLEKSAIQDERIEHLMKNLPKGVDEQAAKSIFNEIVVKGDEVHWVDVAGLEVAKSALKEAVVYPFLRPDLFMGLREPVRGMLLFGPPGTGKTMLARAVATESESTFFAISASSLTSKFLGDSEKLVRALFRLAKALAPSIIFVDEIDSLLSTRAGSGEHEVTRRIKTEFLIQWSDLQKAAAGKEQNDKTEGDASRVLVLAATNLPWAIDEAARRRFVRRQYIPLPEDRVRGEQLRWLMNTQKHKLDDHDIDQLIALTDGFSGSDITALAKDAAMGPLRSLGEQLLSMSPDEIRPITLQDFEASLVNIRPSVGKQGLKEYDDWVKQFGERGE